MSKHLRLMALEQSEAALVFKRSITTLRSASTSFSATAATRSARLTPLRNLACMYFLPLVTSICIYLMYVVLTKWRPII